MKVVLPRYGILSYEERKYPPDTRLKRLENIRIGDILRRTESFRTDDSSAKMANIAPPIAHTYDA